jgi:hypothetical protein
MTYWLARSGQDKPEGPYTQAQLRQRYEAGEADADDQVCLVGTQAWQDLGRLLDLRAWREAQAPQAAPQPLPQVQGPRGMMPRKPDYSSAGLMIQMQRDADMETAKRCSKAVNLLAVGVVLVSIIPGLGIILALGSMGLLAVVATALCIVTIVKGMVGRGIMDLLAVWVFVPVLVVVMQFMGLGVFAGFAQAFKEGAQQAREKQALEKQAAMAPAEAEDPALWALREKVVRYYTAQGMQVEDSVKARSVTVMVSMIQGDSLRYAELQKLAEAGLAIWTAEDGGMLNLLIKDTSGKYLVSGDPISGAKVLR